MVHHVRDEGVAGSNPATPTTAKSFSRKDIRRYDHEADRVICTRSRTRYGFEPAQRCFGEVFIRIDEVGGERRDETGVEDFYGFEIFDAVRGRGAPLAFVMSIDTAELIVDALNTYGARETDRRHANRYHQVKGAARTAGFGNVTEAITAARKSREGGQEWYSE